MNNPKGPLGPLIAGTVGVTVAGEKVHNGWIKRQELILKQNAFATKNRQIAADREAARQQRQIQEQKSAMSKVRQQQNIYRDVKSKKLTVEQGNELIKELNKSVDGKQKPVSMVQRVQMAEAPPLKSQMVKNTIEKPFLDKNSCFNSQDKKDFQFFEEKNFENQEFKLTQLEPYPTIQVVGAAILGGFFSVLSYFALVNIFSKIQNYLNKKN